MPQRLDVINGSAGLIPALIDAAQRFGRDDFVAAAVRHGEHLVGVAARPKEAGPGIRSAANEPHLLGFAHGASGIAYALGCSPRAGGPTFSKRRAGACATSAPTFAPRKATGPTCAVSC